MSPAGKVKFRMPTYADLDARDQKRFQDTLIFVESTSYEQLIIWQEYRYQQLNPGLVIQIGEVGGLPVVGRFDWVTLEGQLLCLYYGCSQVVDYTMIKDWILKTFKPKWDHGGRNAHCDAQNFHIATLAIKEKTGRPVPVHHHCSHPDCYSKQHQELGVVV